MSRLKASQMLKFLPVHTCTVGNPRTLIEEMRLFQAPRERSLSPGRAQKLRPLKRVFS